MTKEQENQLRAIMEIEGASPVEIEATILNIQMNPNEGIKWIEFMRNWKLVTEKKQ